MDKIQIHNIDFNKFIKVLDHCKHDVFLETPDGDSLNLKSKLSQIHTFPYSIRKGTIAEKLQGHLPDNIKENRANIIKQISSEKIKIFLESNLNTTQEVLIEKRLNKDGKYKGVTRNYINVILENGEFNSLKTVHLSSIVNNRILGELKY